MIQLRTIGYYLGLFLVALAVIMLVPAAYALVVSAPGVRPLILASATTAASGAALWAALPKPTRSISRREGLLLSVTTWLAVSFFGALPFQFSPYFHSFTDAFFESVSGFTTTGATVLTRVELLSPPVQFWRCFSHWVGGMGIVLLGVAILPLVGHGGMQLYRAEFSGARSEKLKPRIMETAAALWRIYFAFTVVLFGLLRWAGMNNFEALCHTFSTLGTGGFSTRSDSIAGFGNPLIEYILILFMLLAGVSFIQHYRMFVQLRPLKVLQDVEIRAYVALAAVATGVVFLMLLWDSGYSLEPAFRNALFQVTAILTGTGFVTDDYEVWHPLPQLLLLALMFAGGCTGSTAGGLKISRLLLLGKVVDREFKRMVERRGVFAVRLGGRVVPEATVQSLLNLVYLAFVVNFVSCLLLAAVGIDVLTAISAVAASMFNIGPALGGVGPTDNYGHLPDLAKWVLAVDMIAGRLEFYTVIVIFTPWFWRK